MSSSELNCISGGFLSQEVSGRFFSVFLSAQVVSNRVFVSVCMCMEECIFSPFFSNHHALFHCES